MLGIGCPDRHALPRLTLSKMRRPRYALPPARAGSFIDPNRPLLYGTDKLLFDLWEAPPERRVVEVGVRTTSPDKGARVIRGGGL